MFRLSWKWRKYPEAQPRIISGNGPQFTVKDFKEFIRISGMTHVCTSPFYPQSDGWHKIAQGGMYPARHTAPARRCTAAGAGIRALYNNVRLHSATGYITPKDMLAGQQQEIHAGRDHKLEPARKMRKDGHQQARASAFRGPSVRIARESRPL